MGKQKKYYEVLHVYQKTQTQNNAKSVVLLELRLPPIPLSFNCSVMYTLEVDRYIENNIDISPISVHQYRYSISTLDTGFSINRYRISDK